MNDARKARLKSRIADARANKGNKFNDTVVDVASRFTVRITRLFDWVAPTGKAKGKGVTFINCIITNTLPGYEKYKGAQLPIKLNARMEDIEGATVEWSPEAIEASDNTLAFVCDACKADDVDELIGKHLDVETEMNGTYCNVFTQRPAGSLLKSDEPMTTAQDDTPSEAIPAPVMSAGVGR